MSHPLPISRRELLCTTGCGFASLALAGLCAEQAAAMPRSLAAVAPMFPPRAKRVIFLFMQGGPSHVDSFDYKPRLVRDDGQSVERTGVRFGTFGKKLEERLMKPLWKFQQHGACGQWVSALFPHIARCVDDLCFLQGMHTEGVAHGPATLFMHTGATNLVRPSIGSWITYGLGAENQNLPGFVTINPSSNMGGPRNYSNAFLPAIYQGTALGRAGQSAADASFRHVANRELTPAERRRQFDFLQAFNRQQLAQHGPDDELEATIESYELAFRMQMHAPGVTDTSSETPDTLRRYGIDQRPTEDFGRQCLLARRLAEAGVRYIQVNYSDESTTPRWDQHGNMPQHADHALATDKPVAGLLADLKARGLLDDTLVWWGGEFGRTPFAQGKDGRDHNPRGFTIFLAGGGIKPGFRYGQTDDIGAGAVEGRVHMRDLHATILHLLGIDHEKLTYRYAGRNFRLTDVAGRVVQEVIL